MEPSGDADRAVLTLFLVRHAAHDLVDKVLCGRVPEVRLGPRGRVQATNVALLLARESITAVYSSPLERCRETAAAIGRAVGREPSIAEGLNEIDYGDWTGARFEALQRDPNWRVWNEARARASVPGGESMRSAQQRALRCIERWRIGGVDSRVVAVTHSDLIKAIVCSVLGLSLDRIHAFDIDPASVTTLVLWKGGGKLLNLNQAAPAPAAERSEMAAA